jgi:hypothetical protein
VKKFCLAILRDGYVDEILVKVDTIADPDDIKEVINFAVDEYFDRLEGDGE